MDILPAIEPLSASLINETFRFVAGLDARTWRLGGGTALALHLSHRAISEICLHFDNPPRDSPNVGNHSSEIMFGRNDNGIQLAGLDGFVRVRMQHGILVAQVVPCLTEDLIEDTIVAGKRMRVEPVAEAVAGLLGARWLQVQPKDIFDLAYAAVMVPQQFERAMACCDATLQYAIDVVDALLSDRVAYEMQLRATVQPSASAHAFMSADAAYMLAGVLRKRTSDMMTYWGARCP